jgi:hypothetical protein
MRMGTALAVGTLLAPLALLPTTSAYAADGDTVASGVVQSDGAPVVGARVVALAEPAAAALNAAGSAGMGLVPLGAATTDTDGSFSITGDPADLPAGYHNPDGGVDVDVVASDGKRSISWMYTIDGPGTQRAQLIPTDLLSQSKADRTTPPTHLDLGAGRAWNAGNDPEHWLDAEGHELGARGRDAATHVVVDGPSPMTGYVLRYLRADEATRAAILRAATTHANPATPDETCTAYWTNSWHTDVQEHFMNVYSVSGIPVSVTEGTSVSSSHTLGVAAQVVGGSLSVSGTDSVTFSVGSTQTGVADSTVSNRVNYRLWANTCDPKTYWKPYSLYDFLTDWSYSGHVNYSNCSAKAAGNTWYTTNATDATYAVGVSLPGIGLSAQSGYGTSQRLVYNFHVPGQICGDYFEGPAKSSLVSARL